MGGNDEYLQGADDSLACLPAGSRNVSCEHPDMLQRKECLFGGDTDELKQPCFTVLQWFAVSGNGHVSIF